MSVLRQQVEWAECRTIDTRVVLALSVSSKNGSEWID